MRKVLELCFLEVEDHLPITRAHRNIICICSLYSNRIYCCFLYSHSVTALSRWSYAKYCRFPRIWHSSPNARRIFGSIVTNQITTNTYSYEKLRWKFRLLTKITTTALSLNSFFPIKCTLEYKCITHIYIALSRKRTTRASATSSSMTEVLACSGSNSPVKISWLTSVVCFIDKTIRAHVGTRSITRSTTKPGSVIGGRCVRVRFVASITLPRSAHCFRYVKSFNVYIAVKAKCLHSRNRTKPLSGYTRSDISWRQGNTSERLRRKR